MRTRTLRFNGLDDKITVTYTVPEGDLMARIKHMIWLGTKIGNPYTGPDGKELAPEAVDEAACVKYHAANQNIWLRIAAAVCDQELPEQYAILLGKHVITAIQYGAIIEGEGNADQAKEDLAQDPTR